MNNIFCWMQLQSKNLPAAKDFYQRLFAWSLDEDADPQNPYTHIDAGEGPCGGMATAPKGVPSHWLPFVQVEDIDVSTEKAKILGANVIITPTSIPQGGRYSVFMDPTGATIGLYEPSPTGA